MQTDRMVVDKQKAPRRYFHIPKMLIINMERQPDALGIKDGESRFVYANQAYMELLGLPPDYDISGRFDHELPAPTAAYAEYFRVHDRLVEQTGTPRTSLEVHRFGSKQELSAYFFEKRPLFSEDEKVIGTMFCGRPAEHLSLSFYSTIERPRSIMLTQPDHMFTNAQWEVIFLLEQRYSQKEIARILELTPKAVNKRISTIYQKLNISSTRQLIDFINVNGWQTYIPQKFIMSGHFLIP